MKTKTKTLLSLLALGASTWVLLAQGAGNHPQPREGGRPSRGEAPPGPGPEGHRPPPPPPVMVVLDANHDGVIDAKEIANASQALLQLDENQDGQLTRDELRPPPPPDGFDGPPPGDGPPPCGPPPGE